MREDWDQRARENARYYVNTATTEWTDDEFFASGEKTVAEEILTDMGNICQGKPPARNAGAGDRVRGRAGDPGAGRNVRRGSRRGCQWRDGAAGRGRLERYPNAFVYQNNGQDLSVVPDLEFDFAFSSIVFQHIPSREIIENYVREVQRLLRPGALFKFQVQGDSTLETQPDDTWLGVPFSDRQVVEMALRCGFEPRYRHGAGEQYFWLWFFKR